MSKFLIAIGAYLLIGLIYTNLSHKSHCWAGSGDNINWLFWIGDAVERYGDKQRDCPEPLPEPFNFEPTPGAYNPDPFSLENEMKAAYERYKENETLCLIKPGANSTTVPADIVKACTAVLERGRKNEVSGVGYEPELLPEIYVRRGEAHLYTGTETSGQNALLDFAAAIDVDPDYADAYRARSRAFSGTQEIQYVMKRIGDLEQLARLEPNNAAVFLDLSHSYARLTNAERAIAAIDRAIEIAPNAEYYAMRGAILLSENNIDLADADFTAVLDINAGHGAALAGRAMAAGARGNYAALIDEMGRAIKAAPENPVYVMARAGAYIHTGQDDLALSDLYDTLSLNPGNALALEWRAAAFVNLGKIANARDDCNRINSYGAPSEICTFDAENSVQPPPPDYLALSLDAVREAWIDFLDLPPPA